MMKIENAPGLKWRRNKWGRVALWRPRTDLVKRGLPLHSLRLFAATEAKPTPDAADVLYIADRCQALQADMMAWARGGLPVLPMPYEATWESLVRCYQTDPDSPYHKKRYSSRQHYDTLCRRVVKDCGPDKIADTDARKLLRLHEAWSSGGKVAMGHAMIGMLRTLTTFGSTLLKCQACKAIRMDLHDMRVAAGKPREAALTADQALAVILESRKSYPSIALAQAFQFDCALRQKDVIGEWVPVEEMGPLSDIVNGGRKWIRGLRWDEIDQALVLRHVTSKRQKPLVMDLTLCPMVMAELQLVTRPRSGPVIVNDKTGFPWETSSFRHEWRKIARAAGIPDDVRNMDTRAGAATEATGAGAPIEHVKHMMTHSDISMTQRYSRGSDEKVAEVMRTRVAYRNKEGNK